MTGKDIEKAAALLKDGSLVAIPTETVYGLAANAFDENAVLSVFKAKKRPEFDPLIVHSDSMEKIRGFVRHVPAEILELTAEFWPGPLTILFEKLPVIPDLVTSGLSTVAVRIPAHPMTLRLLSLLDFPLAAPSANRFGYISPTSARHVEESFGDNIAYILDGGECRIGVESTIIKVESGTKLKVLRPGGIPVEKLRGFAAEMEMASSSALPDAPGMLDSHYAPSIPLIFGDMEELLAANKSRKAAVLSFTDIYSRPGIVRSLALSPSGDLDEAAKKLFAYMRLLDNSGAEVILAEEVPAEGLGIAINDRLRRAAAKRTQE